jgi:biopolymer transport protein ExbD
LATWDVFHSDRLELRRSLDTAEVRAGLEKGEIVEDDLIRPSGSSAPWTRIGDMPELLAPAPEPAPAPAPEPGPAPSPEATVPDIEYQRGPERPREPPSTIADIPVSFRDLIGGEADVVESGGAKPGPGAGTEAKGAEEGWPGPAASPFDVAEHEAIPGPPPAPRGGPLGEFDLKLRGAGRGGPESSIELVASSWDDGLDLVDGVDGEGDGEEYDPLEEDEAVAEFTLSRNAPEKVEELDLAAMVDVAFQLVLFFLVTATTVLYKTLEVPKPNPESSPTAAAAQGRSKTLDELKDDFILVEIDPAGQVKVDHEPVPAEHRVLVERLRSERERTSRKSMLLSADFSTPHRNAVLAYDVANEIGLGIAIARPSGGQDQAPAAPLPRR